VLPEFFFGSAPALVFRLSAGMLAAVNFKGDSNTPFLLNSFFVSPGLGTALFGVNPRLIFFRYF
jgi:hypothetical protein